MAARKMHDKTLPVDVGEAEWAEPASSLRTYHVSCPSRLGWKVDLATYRISSARPLAMVGGRSTLHIEAARGETAG